jgi:hypothetical protein
VTAAACVGQQTNALDGPLQWSDVSADPVGAVCRPASVYEAGCSYPVAQCSLTEQADKDLAALCRALELEVDQVTVQFGREAVEEATKLGAAHQSASGFQSLIVGDDVAAQLAADYIKAQLRAQRAQRPAARRARAARARARAPASGWRALARTSRPGCATTPRRSTTPSASRSSRTSRPCTGRTAPRRGRCARR